MTFANDLFTQRTVQVRAIIFVLIGILYFAFVISQFVAVDSAQRNPRYTAFFNLPDSDGSFNVEFPKFSVCPMFGGEVRTTICNYVSDSTSEGVSDIVKTTRVIFTPQHGDAEFSCYDVRPTEDHIASTHREFISCEVSSANPILIQFFTDYPISENADNVFMWDKLTPEEYANIGVYPVDITDSAGNLENTRWNSVVLSEPFYSVNGSDLVSFSVQYLSAETLQLRRFIPYDFWTMLGVVGGAALVFYALFKMIVFAIFQAMGLKDSDFSSNDSNYASYDNAGGSGGKYEEIDDSTRTS